MYFLLVQTMIYQLFCRLTNPPAGDAYAACWNKMPYAPRGRYDCDHIMRIYRERFGSRYEYVYMPLGMQPPGLNLPR